LHNSPAPQTEVKSILAWILSQYPALDPLLLLVGELGLGS